MDRFADGQFGSLSGERTHFLVHVGHIEGAKDVFRRPTGANAVNHRGVVASVREDLHVAYLLSEGVEGCFVGYKTAREDET